MIFVDDFQSNHLKVNGGRQRANSLPGKWFGGEAKRAFEFTKQKKK